MLKVPRKSPLALTWSLHLAFMLGVYCDSALSMKAIGSLDSQWFLRTPSTNEHK